jgi:ferric-dicitrate binding protein FerR (iron transport regulator)
VGTDIRRLYQRAQRHCQGREGREVDSGSLRHRSSVGDKLTTGPNSRVSVSLSDGSQLELNDSSALVLTENILNPDGSRASTKVTLLSGLVRALVKIGPGSPPNFEVHTPNAVASARGTMFDVSYHEGQPPPAMP